MDMTSRIHITFLIVIITLTVTQVNAQDSSLKMISFRDEDRILLRWAPVNASDWIELNKVGYSLKRYTIIRDSVRVYPPELVVLKKSLKPETLIEWESFSYDNDYAAVVAQSIYGDSFNPELDNTGTDIGSIIQRSKEQDMRFSFCLIAADQSFEVARMAGLAYEDKSISKDEKYLYKLYGNFSSKVADTIYLVVDESNSPPLPVINDFISDFGDKVVTLSWRTDYLSSVYTSYILEKSIDGKSFQPADKNPAIIAIPENNENSKRMIKTDSLLDNKTKYYYRIRGKSPFGSIGPPSKTISGFGRKDFKIGLAITNGEVKKEGIEIFWGTDDKSSSIATKYIIHRSMNSDVYEQLDSVPGTENSYLDKQPLSSNYYRIVAISKNGQKIETYPFFVQLEDSISPQKPVGLRGMADTTGIVQLKWHENIEKDLSGYRVYRSRIKDNEYRQITITEINDAFFKDSVGLSTLSRKMYYRIQSIDNRGNRSKLSDPIKVSLPDKIPPVPPRIIGYEQEASKTKIRWTNSSSKDVLSTRIYRIYNSNIHLLTEISNNSGITSYTDSSNVSGEFDYYLIAVDSAGNKSIRSNVIRLTKRSKRELNFEVKAIVDRINGVIDLEWNIKMDNGVFKIYRSKDNEPLTLYHTLEKNDNGFRDFDLVINSKYKYMVQANNVVNRISITSNQIEIRY